MAGSASIERLEAGGIFFKVFFPPRPSPGLLLLPESRSSTVESLAEKLLLEEFSVVLPESFPGYTEILTAFEDLRSNSPVKSRVLQWWVWGEGRGGLWALRLSRDLGAEIRGLILDSLRAEDREEASGLLSALRKPHLLFHPQLEDSFPFPEAERMFTLSPAHAKKLLLLPGMRRGEVLLKSPDLYVQTIAEFVNPRAGRWRRKKDSLRG
ncbi:aminopeptidase [Thermosulfurimonas marina]|uniref:Aminopeptidase n=1 Tax=Thermosulfurimonas marina TaxID=2047767 RepID=A0A6H1WRQ8_9BACT|nr:aminopeptidase [Thermosulfurimonas marina]QJA05905.1 aminopeptidase [Thermosulfurimonas marina]